MHACRSAWNTVVCSPLWYVHHKQTTMMSLISINGVNAAGTVKQSKDTASMQAAVQAAQGPWPGTR